MYSAEDCSETSTVTPCSCDPVYEARLGRPAAVSIKPLLLACVSGPVSAESVAALGRWQTMPVTDLGEIRRTVPGGEGASSRGSASSVRSPELSAADPRRAVSELGCVWCSSSAPEGRWAPDDAVRGGSGWRLSRLSDAYRNTGRTTDSAGTLVSSVIRFRNTKRVLCLRSC